MRLLAPANPKELVDRSRWFETPEAKKLAQGKGVEFGVEIKGPLKNIQKAMDCFWGIHFPDHLATEWYYNAKHPELRSSIMRELVRVAKLKPNYAVIHGIHLIWHPPAKESVRRFIDRGTSLEYFKILDANIMLINEIKSLFNLKLENYPLYFYYLQDEGYQPYTFLSTGIGRLDDLVYVKEKTGVEIMFDIEHMLITLNLLQRKRNYANLPVKKIEELTPEEQKLKEIFGFNLKKGYIPYLDKEITLSEMIKKVGAKYYHVTGGVQDVITGKRVAAHAPIKLDDKFFRKNLRLVLAQKPEVMLVETSNSTLEPKTFPHLKKNETEISFRNLCRILLEEL